MLIASKYSETRLMLHPWACRTVGTLTAVGTLAELPLIGAVPAISTNAQEIGCHNHAASDNLISLTECRLEMKNRAQTSLDKLNQISANFSKVEIFGLL